VWDDLELRSFLDRSFPEVGFAMLLAHEWGHVAQFQLGPVTRSTLLNEQQADCYAGAYLRWAESRGVEPFTTPRARDLAIVSTLQTRDQIGASPASETAHGNGFDRIRATQEGYDQGPGFCASYDETPPPITQMTFETPGDAQTQGNLSFDNAVILIEPAVSDFFNNLSDVPIELESLAVDEASLQGLHASIGDGAVATVIGSNYAAAFQAASGLPVDGVEAALQRTCFLGGFLHEAMKGELSVSVNDRPTTINLSPGDLDETITTLVSSPGVMSSPGLVFEVVNSLRIGTVQSIDGCMLDN